MTTLDVFKLKLLQTNYCTNPVKQQLIQYLISSPTNPTLCSDQGFSNSIGNYDSRRLLQGGLLHRPLGVCHQSSQIQVSENDKH